MKNQMFAEIFKLSLPSYSVSSTAIVAALAAVSGLCASVPQSQAQGLFWIERPYYYEPQDRIKPRQQTRRAKRSYPRVAAEPKKSDPKPEGPLLIAVSIEKQRLKIYDANGVWAESPISSGTRSNPTPLGVFSIIQKNKWHRSNLYSGAPMPYMQRITWSGVALHAGVLPGYPASHGCIRLPGDFAARLWGWTKLGARVVVTPGETTPVDIAHAKLIAKIITPPPEQPSPAPVAGAPGSEPAKNTGGTEAPAVKPETNAIEPAPPEKRSDNELRLRTVHDESAGPGTHGETIRTADASGAALLPVAALVDAADDAAPTGGATGNPADAAPRVDDAKSENAATGGLPDGAKDNTKDSAKDSAKDGTAPSASNTAETPASGSQTTETAKADAAKTDAAEPNPVSTAAAEPKSSEVPASAPEAPKPATAESDKPADKPAAAPASAEKSAATAATVPADKPKADKPVAEKKAEPAPKKRTGHVAAFVSRKEGRLFVRQGFDAWFDVPVTIDDPSRPLGTHVFTAHKAGASENELRWTVFTVTPRRVEATDQSARRRGKQPAKAEPAPPPLPSSTASEALDRIAIPQESLDRIAEVIGAGGSLTISDQGLGPETGRGTDFIVLAR
jgi:lipoprotein-anchoring transpeptidase ErfK/SrfK